MVVTIENNLTTYHYGKNCVVKIRKIYKDGIEQYLFEFGCINRLSPSFSVWSVDIPTYYRKLVFVAFNYIGFDRNMSETDIRGLVIGIRNYLRRKRCIL